MNLVDALKRLKLKFPNSFTKRQEKQNKIQKKNGEFLRQICFRQNQNPFWFSVHTHLLSPSYKCVT